MLWAFYLCKHVASKSDIRKELYNSSLTTTTTPTMMMGIMVIIIFVFVNRHLHLHDSSLLISSFIFTIL